MSNEKTREQALIRAISKSETVVNSTTIENFWQVVIPIDRFQKQNYDPRETALNLIKQAKQIILIYAPYVTYDAVKIELENLAKAGIRSYAILKDLPIHAKILTSSVARERKSIDSTFILIDPNEKGSSRGIWFPGGLTKENSSQPLILEMTTIQIAASSIWFKNCFWDANGDELFLGKRRPAKKLAEKPEKEATNQQIFNELKDMKEILKNESVHEIWVDLARYEVFSEYLAEANVINFEIQDELKDIVDFEGINPTARVFALTGKLPFNYIRTENSRFIYTNDIIFEMNDAQGRIIQEESYYYPLELARKSKISDINGEILSQQQMWTKITPVPIKENEIRNLDPVATKNIDQWLSVKAGTLDLKPEFPESIIFAHKITYKWNIEPPYLPSNAKKHRIYSLWEDFKRKYEDTIENVKKQIKTALDDENKYKKKKFLPKKGIWINTVDELEKLAQGIKVDIEKFDILNERIERLTEINREFISQLNDLNSTAGDDKEDKSESELDVFQKVPENEQDKKQQDKQLKPMKGKEFQLSDLKKSIPPSRLPSTGLLYEWNNRNFLVIETVQEIESAKTELPKYPPCEICTLRNK